MRTIILYPTQLDSSPHQFFMEEFEKEQIDRNWYNKMLRPSIRVDEKDPKIIYWLLTLGIIIDLFIMYLIFF